MQLSSCILYLHAASTLAMTGLIWFVQLVHYPLFAAVGAEHFEAYEVAHNRLTTLVVGPLMVTETATALLLALRWGVDPPVVPTWIGLGLLVVIWISTLSLQVPQHTILLDGFDAAAHQRLTSSNWIRTVAWTLRGGLALWLLRASPLVK